MEMKIEVMSTGKTAPYGIGELIGIGIAKTVRGISRIVNRRTIRGVSRYVLGNGTHIIQDPDGHWVVDTY